MRAIKSAEKLLWETETTKAYTGMVGEAGFRESMIGLVLGEDAPRDRIASATTPGGTGAIHQALELVKESSPDARIWVSDPSWPNHRSMAAHLGFSAGFYRYFDRESRSVDFDSMREDLAPVTRGDVVILHGCCHNPTGADLDLQQWAEIAELLNAKGAIGLVDIAYQGIRCRARGGCRWPAAADVRNSRIAGGGKLFEGISVSTGSGPAW